MATTATATHAATHPTTAEPLCAAVEEHIRVRVHRLIGMFGYTESDRDDLEQELRVAVLERRCVFDATKSTSCVWENYVVDGRITDLLRRRQASNRSYRRVQECASRADDVLRDAHPRVPVDHGATCAQRQCDVRMDIEAVTAAMTGEQRELCRLLATTSISEAARRLGLPRWRAHELLREIRQRMTDAGLAPSA